MLRCDHFLCVFQFTDNGVIVFQRNIYDRTYALSYPYTTFESNDPYTPPILAAFWADVDLSGFGDIFYQVMSCRLLDSYKMIQYSLKGRFTKN